jgi:hypothetical protein
MIHGDDQLEVPEHGTLHLHVVRLEDVPAGGRSVLSLVDEILALGVPAESLFGSLTAAGVPLTDLAATSETTFEVLDRMTVPVDDALPRIVPATFVGGERPLGVVDMNYTIDLDHSVDRALGENEYAAMVNHFATAA